MCLCVERLAEIDSLATRLNILLSDFADLLAELSRFRHLASSSSSSSSMPAAMPAAAAAAAAVPRYRHAGDKRNTFDELAVGGRFG